MSMQMVEADAQCDHCGHIMVDADSSGNPVYKCLNCGYVKPLSGSERIRPDVQHDCGCIWGTRTERKIIEHCGGHAYPEEEPDV